MNTLGLIDVTGVSLEKLVRTAYNLSRPQGLGVYAYQPGDLTDADVQKIIDLRKDDELHPLSMDYIRGRSCKFHVRRVDGKHYIENSWYDHSDEQLVALLNSVGISGREVIDAARKEYNDDSTIVIAETTDLLLSNGGTLSIESYADEEKLPATVSRGLTHLAYGDDPRVTVTYGKNGARTFTLITTK